MKKHVLIVAAHPDDELLGSGGTIKKLIQNGFEVVTVITAKGRPGEDHHIRQIAMEANNHLGIKDVILLNFPNLELECSPLHLISSP